jgi:formylglycine-generating enzyme required for sulfatase activity
MKLLLIPAGTFTSGSPASEKDRDDDETQHQVTLSKPFYMGRTEVTQGQWKKVMGTEPWKGEAFVQEGDD